MESTLSDNNLQQVVKQEEIKMAIRLKEVWAKWWETLMKELGGLSQSMLLKECIKLRMAVYVAQRDGLRCSIQDEHGNDVDLAEYLNLSKPQSGKF